MSLVQWERCRTLSAARRAAGPKKPEEEGDTLVEKKEKTSVPKRWRVIFHNDDYTTMEYVVLVLMQFFHKTEAEAFHLMLTVHKKGSASVGLFPREVAETKVDQVMKHARDHGMPLLVTAEPE
jgi:ATP-dependent Clp protease adaptor protein ClpS